MDDQNTIVLTQEEIDRINVALDKVEGWLWEDSAWLTAFLLKEQNIYIDKNKYSGAVEFGTYKGKYLCVIYSSMMINNESVIGYDIFKLNSTEELVNNIELVCGSSKFLIPVISNTKEIKPHSIIEKNGSKPRFISIDAEHTFEGVYNDMMLASSVLCEGGIIAVDDFTNVHCPGVTEGAISFLNSAHNLNLTPFVSCCNKLFITTNKFHHEYYLLVEKFLLQFSNLNVAKYYNTRSYSQNHQILCKYPIHVLSHVKGANFHLK